MALPTWLTVNPMSGSGNNNIMVSATNNLGREQRSYTLTISSPYTDKIAKKVIQAGSAPYITLDESEVTLDKNGGTVTIKGKSNSRKLKWSLDSNNDHVISEIQVYTVNGNQVQNNIDIPDDPGKSGEYEFSRIIPIGENLTTSSKTSRILISRIDTYDGEEIEAIPPIDFTIKQSAGDPFLNFGDGAPTTISLKAITSGNEPVGCPIESNTSWSVS